MAGDKAHTSFKDPGQGASPSLQVEADVKVQNVGEGVVSHTPPRCLQSRMPCCGVIFINLCIPESATAHKATSEHLGHQAIQLLLKGDGVPGQWG